MGEGFIRKKLRDNDRKRAAYAIISDISGVKERGEGIRKRQKEMSTASSESQRTTTGEQKKTKTL